MLQPPSATAFDAVASALSLVVYVAVALAAIARAPGDARTRAFLAVALASAVPYLLSPLQWWKGNGVYTPMAIALTTTAFAIGSVALFHFTQVFPRRRPWIRRYFPWLGAAYVALPAPVAAIAWIVAGFITPAGGGLGAASDTAIAVALLMSIPIIFVVGIVLPFAGITSLFKSWQEAKKAGDEAARFATLWMVVSQLAGGVLAVLVLPLLHFVGISTAVATVVAAFTYLFALLMPLTFAAAVWRDGVLSTSDE